MGSRCEPWVSHAKGWAVPGKPPIFETLKALVLRGPPKHVSSDYDPLFRFHRWLANLRVREIEAVKSVPYAPVSHPFVERLIGTIRRESWRHSRITTTAIACIARSRDLRHRSVPARTVPHPLRWSWSVLRGADTKAQRYRAHLQ